MGLGDLGRRQRRPHTAGTAAGRQRAVLDVVDQHLAVDLGRHAVMAGGQQVLLVQTPRSFRGGLSFIF